VILGVDHVALTALDLDDANDNMRESGFECVFIEKEIPNHPSKAHLLHDLQLTHDLGYFRPPSGVPIEVTVYGPTVAPQPSPFRYDTGLIRLSTNDVAKESRFLSDALSFRPNKPDVLHLGSPIANWRCTLQLEGDPLAGVSTLDSPGYPCLALLSNSIFEDLTKVKQAGATDLTDVFRLKVGGRSLWTVLFRSPTGTILELVDVATSEER
jgi:hypothetical protein|tara:strand:- start:345 stop:977 length:633 start_codon:yes stop_codon:yes gene_type:complete